MGWHSALLLAVGLLGAGVRFELELLARRAARKEDERAQLQDATPEEWTRRQPQDAP